MDHNSDRLFLSVITVAEVGSGIAKARREGVTRKADRLAEWWDTVLHLYTAHILTLDVAVARTLGGLSDRARSAGQSPGLADLVIAATARCHGYTVLTRNVRHFQSTGVPVIDPCESLASLA